MNEPDPWCPECGWHVADGHGEGCHVYWAEHLKDSPIPAIVRNPFVAMLKEPTGEHDEAIDA